MTRFNGLYQVHCITAVTASRHNQHRMMFTAEQRCTRSEGEERERGGRGQIFSQELFVCLLGGVVTARKRQAVGEWFLNNVDDKICICMSLTKRMS